MEASTTKGNRRLGEGHVALYVSNRADPTLQAALKRELHFKEVKWCVASPRSLDGVAQSIRKGVYSLVLLQTAFLDHSTDDKLVKVCKGANVPYLRVDKGRPVMVEREMWNKGIQPILHKDLPIPRTRVSWSGGELVLIEDLALQGKTDPEIATELAKELGVQRTPSSIGQARKAYFGIVKGKKELVPEKNLPDFYFDVRQAQELSKDSEEQVEEQQPEAEENSLVDYSQEEVPEFDTVKVASSSNENEKITITLEGPKGACVIETDRTAEELFSFMMGYSS